MRPPTVVEVPSLPRPQIVWARAAFPWRAYLAIARPEHWFKNVFLLPGTLLAILLTGQSLGPQFLGVLLLGGVSVCLVASANYVINEYLDAPFDQFHPVKRLRPCVSEVVRGRWVLVEYLLLGSSGLGLASLINGQFLWVSVALLGMGVVYNVPPLRLKDRHYLDVLSESVNNPLRFLLGWSLVLGNALPPSSVLITYWMGGAFLMGIKRYAEYRTIADPVRAGQYRRSFRFYTESSLLLSSFFYALVSAFFLGIFLIKYRIEFLLTFPLFALLFTWYLALGMRDGSAAQSPEKLFREPQFLAFTTILAAIVVVLFSVDLPWLHLLLEQQVYGMP